jgi:hypothetical protein
MSKDLDRLKHLVVKMQVRYGEHDPDVLQLLADVQALEAYEAKGRSALESQPLPQQWDRRMRRGDGARA